MRRIVIDCLAVAIAAGVSISVALAQQQTQPPGTAEAPIEGERVVVTGMVPIPEVGEGAPLFTSSDVALLEQTFRKTQAESERDFRRCGGRVAQPCFNKGGNLDVEVSLNCEIEYARKAADLAARAAEATAHAEDVRRAAADGHADMKAVEEAELARQEAVNRMQKQRLKLLEIQANIGVMQKLRLMGRKQVDTADLLAHSIKRDQAGWGLGIAQPDTPKGLAVSDVKASLHSDRKGEYVIVQGLIRNSEKKSSKIPDLSATLVDERGWPLVTVSVSPVQKRSIPGGGSHPFGFEVRPAPQAMEKAVVYFASRYTPPARMGMGPFCGGWLRG